MDVIDIFLILMLAFVLTRFFVKTPSAAEQEINKQLEKTVMVTIEHHVDSQGGDVYLICRADNNEFITQCYTLDEVVPAIVKKFTDYHIMFATENRKLIGLFLPKETT